MFKNYFDPKLKINLKELYILELKLGLKWKFIIMKIVCPF